MRRVSVSLLIGLLLLFGTISHAASETDSRFSGLSTEDFEVLDSEELAVRTGEGTHYSDGLEFLDFGAPDEVSFLDWLFSWAPTGRAAAGPSPECAADRLEQTLARPGLDQGSKASIAQEFLVRCEAELTRHTRWWVRALLSIENAHYELGQNRNIRPVRMTLPGNVRIRGVLGLKPGTVRRPLILVKCGLYCDSEDSPSTRVILMHLFDESPFNVLVLSNVTGVRFAEDNQHYSLGGFDEGRQLFLAARMVRRLPLGALTSEIHAGGLSLGGQAALFASLYNDFNVGDAGERVLSSTIALCPVVDLESTLRSNLSGGIRGRLFRYLTVRQILKILSFIPILGELFDPDDPPGNRELRDVVARGALDYYRKLSDRRVNWTLPPFAAARFERIEDLWSYNNFLTFQSWVRTPTLVWAAQDDGIVPTSINTEALGKAVEREPGAGAVQVIQTRWGSHCATSVTHGWETSSGFVRGYYLSHSPEFVGRERVRRADLFGAELPRGLRLRRGEIHLRQHWSARAGKDAFRVEFEIWSPYRDSRCVGLRPGQDAVAEVGFSPDNDCVRRERVRIRIGEAVESGFQVPSNETEAQALSRWANSAVRVVADSGAPIVYTDAEPTSVEWKTYR